MEYFFIHNPKAAGTSITKALKEVEFKTGYKITLYSDTHHNKPTVIKKHFGEENYKKIHKIVVIRNPLTRLISGYFHLKSKGLLKDGFTFNQFVETLSIKDGKYRQFYDNQHKWIKNDKNQTILRYSCLEYDFYGFLEKHKLPHVELKHLNRGNYSYDYVDAVLLNIGTETMARIKKLYRRDFELWNNVKPVK